MWDTEENHFRWKLLLGLGGEMVFPLVKADGVSYSVEEFSINVNGCHTLQDKVHLN